MNPFWLLLIGAGAVYALWIFYLAVMCLKRAKDADLLHKRARIFGTPVLIVGYALDVLVNIIVMTVLLGELPHETTVTARLKRHLKTSTGWRLKVARGFVPLLDPFDPSGRHISEGDL